MNTVSVTDLAAYSWEIATDQQKEDLGGKFCRVAVTVGPLTGRGSCADFVAEKVRTKQP